MTETNTRLNPKDLATITVLIVSAFIVILNETIMVVAIPRADGRIQRSATTPPSG